MFYDPNDEWEPDLSASTSASSFSRRRYLNLLVLLSSRCCSLVLCTSVLKNERTEVYFVHNLGYCPLYKPSPMEMNIPAAVLTHFLSLQEYVTTTKFNIGESRPLLQLIDIPAFHLLTSSLVFLSLGWAVNSKCKSCNYLLMKQSYLNDNDGTRQHTSSNVSASLIFCFCGSGVEVCWRAGGFLGVCMRSECTPFKAYTVLPHSPLVK